MHTLARSFADISVGGTASLQHTISESDVQAFIALSGDTNPIHTDRAAAERAGFPEKIVHGALLSGLCSTLVGVHLPGSGAVIVKHTIQFKLPTFVGDTLTVVGTVTFKSAATHLIEVTIEISRDHAIVATAVTELQLSR